MAIREDILGNQRAENDLSEEERHGDSTRAEYDQSTMGTGEESEFE